jgi:hypothetical protein
MSLLLFEKFQKRYYKLSFQHCNNLLFTCDHIQRIHIIKKNGQQQYCFVVTHNVLLYANIVERFIYIFITPRRFIWKVFIMI